MQGTPSSLSELAINPRPSVFDLSECGRPGLLKAASERGKTKTGKRGGPGGGPAPRRHGWSSVPLNKAFFTIVTTVTAVIAVIRGDGDDDNDNTGVCLEDICVWRDDRVWLNLVL